MDRTPEERLSSVGRPKRNRYLKKLRQTSRMRKRRSLSRGRRSINTPGGNAFAMGERDTNRKFRDCDMAPSKAFSSEPKGRQIYDKAVQRTLLSLL